MIDETKSKSELEAEVAELRRQIDALKTAEAKMLQERILLRTLIDNLPDGIYAKDTAFRKTLANPADVRNLGAKSEAEVLGKDDFAFFPKSVAEGFLADDKVVLETGTPVLNREELALNVSGEKRWLLTSKLPLRNQQGDIVGILGIGRDITARRQAEEAVQHERNLLRTLIDNLPDGIYAKDRACRKTLANPADVRNLGANSEAEVLGKDDFAFFPKSVAEGFLVDDKVVLETGTPVLNREELALNVSGEKRWLLTSKLPLRNQQGDIVGILGIGRDITARRQAEEAVQRERNLLRTLIDNLPDLIFFKDNEGRYILNNQPHLRSLGIARQEDALGKTTFDFNPPALAQAYREDEQRISRTGVPLLEKEELAFHQDTSEKRWHLTSKIPLRDTKGDVMGLVGISRDITEKKQLEEASRESAEKFRLVFETAFDGISIFEEGDNPDQRKLIECNARFAELAGRSREELLGIGYTDTLTKTLENGHRQPIGQGAAFRGSFTWLRPDKKENIIEYAGVPITLRGKNFTISIDRDVTEQRKAQWKIRDQMKVIEEQNLELERARDEAMEANRTKSSFLASMSHELRTPLNAIIGYSEMIIEEMADTGNTTYNDDLERIRAAGKHLLGLINDVLDLSKIEAGKMDLYLEEFDMRSLVQEVLGTVRPLLEKNENTLRTDVASDLPIVHLDLTKVRQILFNLISNASKFTRKGMITMTVGSSQVSGTDEGKIIFKISDTGIGLSEEQKGRLFKEFSQADSSTTRKYGGTGLGLAITKRFVDMMSGHIEVDSAPGQGTTFTVVLPKRIESPLPTPITPVKHQEKLSSPAPTDIAVLVVDDDPSARDLLMRYLSKEGYFVECVSSGDEGLKRAREILPMAIILDVMMPHKDGWAVLQEIKADSVLKSIPVIMYTMVDEKNFGLAIGASEYLIKPVSKERILQVLEKFKPPAPTGHILIVDDDANLTDLASRTIEKAGWGVQTAENGKIALSKLQRNLPSIIFLDLMMPVMDGFEFLAEFQEHEEWRTIPVVVITSKDLSSDERQQLSGMVKKIIQKGDLTPEKLLKHLSILIPQLTHTLPTGGQRTNG